MTTITTRALLEQALEALEMATDNYDDSAVGIEINAILAIRAELAKPVEQVEQNWNRSIRDSVDALLSEAGYQPDSSARHQLAMMNFDQKAQTTPAWHDAPEVAALKSEIERLKGLADSEGTRTVEYLRRARKAEAEIERLRKDAERLDYIEESGNFGVTRYRSGPGGPVLIEAEDGKKDISKSASSLRDAIDSVIKEAK